MKRPGRGIALPRHTAVRRSAGGLMMLVRLRGKTFGPNEVATRTMAFSEALIPIEEVQVRFRRQLSVSSYACEPHEELGRHRVYRQHKQREPQNRTPSSAAVAHVSE